MGPRIGPLAPGAEPGDRPPVNSENVWRAMLRIDALTDDGVPVSMNCPLGVPTRASITPVPAGWIQSNGLAAAGGRSETTWRTRLASDGVSTSHLLLRATSASASAMAR